MNTYSILTDFKTEKECYKFLVSIRWPNGIKCRFCSCNQVSIRKKCHRFKCNKCNKSFSVCAGTIFHGTKIPLRKWFTAISMILNAKKGISSLQLSRTIDVNKNTAWYMQVRVRRAMNKHLTLHGLLNPDKTMMENQELSNKRFLKKMKRLSKGNKMVHFNPETAENPIMEFTSSKSTQGINSDFQFNYQFNVSSGYYHYMIKRSIIGQYHIFSPWHFQSYLDEISFKYHTNSKDSFLLILYHVLGKLCH